MNPENEEPRTTGAPHRILNHSGQVYGECLELARVFAGKAIRQDASGFICLTDMWKASGESKDRTPKQFFRLSQTQALFHEARKEGENPNALESREVKTTLGRTGGTWGTKELAIAYAKYLSPKFHLWALKVIRERMEEEVDPELGIHRATERARKRWVATGHSEQWIANRLRVIECIPDYENLAKRLATRTADLELLTGTITDFLKSQGA